MANPLFKASRRAIQGVRRANAQDLTGDLKATQSQLDAIFGNLSTSGKGIARTLTAQQSRELAAISRLASRTNRANRAGLGRTAEQATSRYGSAMGGVVSQQLDVAKATAGASRTVGKAGKSAARILAAGGKDALSIQRSATGAAQAGADYALAAALKQRGSADAAQVAEMQFQLAQTKLQYKLEAEQMELQSQLDFENWQKKFDYENDLAEKEGRQAFTQVYASAPLAATSFFQYGHEVEVVGADGKPTGEMVRATPSQLAQRYASEAGIINADGSVSDPAQYQLILRMAQYYQSGMGPVEAAQTAVSSLYGDSKGFDVDAANESIMLGVRASMQATQARLLSDFENLSDSDQELYERINAWRTGSQYAVIVGG